jgi:hypothetical protein
MLNFVEAVLSVLYKIMFSPSIEEMVLDTIFYALYITGAKFNVHSDYTAQHREKHSETYWL